MLQKWILLLQNNFYSVLHRDTPLEWKFSSGAARKGILAEAESSASHLFSGGHAIFPGGKALSDESLKLTYRISLPVLVLLVCVVMLLPLSCQFVTVYASLCE